MLFPEREDLEKDMQRLAAEQCAPVMFGIKPSNLLIIDPGYDPVLMSVVAGTGLKIRCFYFGGGRQVWFMYQEKMLIRYLSRPENREFMQEYGYTADMSLGQILMHAAQRFREYKKGLAPFPHEMGIILGYPLEDVNGFMCNQGKNYLLSGYWKVYYRPANARRIFKEYDEATERMIKELVG